MSLFDQAQYEMENVEFLNLAGSTVNDKNPWDEEVVETLIQMVSRENSHVYGINLGEIYFTKDAMKYLHDNLHRTWIGFMFVEANYNVFPPKGWFRGTNRDSTLARNRREKPLWTNSPSDHVMGFIVGHCLQFHLVFFRHPAFPTAVVD
jgi:hypothetical protein